MDEIEVLVNDLYEMIKQLKEDGMDTVTISILPADDNDGDRIPPSLWFEASTFAEPEIGIDYENVFAYEP